MAIRTHSCPNCGALLDRDYNSAVNHKQNGLKELSSRLLLPLLPVERREFAPAETPKESQKREICTAMYNNDNRLAEEEGEETAGESLSGKPAPFRTW